MKKTLRGALPACLFLGFAVPRMNQGDALASAQANALAYERMYRAMSCLFASQSDMQPADPLSASEAAEARRIAARVDDNWTFAIAAAVVHGTLVEGSDAFEHLLTQVPEWPDRARVVECITRHIMACTPGVDHPTVPREASAAECNQNAHPMSDPAHGAE